MVQENKKKTIIISSITAILVLITTIILCLAFTYEGSPNQQLELSNADYTYTDTYGDWTYTVSGSDATITKFTGSTPDVVIPSTITKDGTTYTVKALYRYSASGYDDGVFYGVRSTLQNITIPNTITTIGGYAFSNCTGLTSVEIPASVTSIVEGAFECTGLTSITIPASVTSIGSRVFYNCTGLTSVEIPASVTSIGSSAFQNCKGLTSVTIGNSVTSIGSDAFLYCYKLLEVINKSSLTITAGSARVSGSSNSDYVGYYAKQIITDASQSKYQVIDNIKYYIDSSNNKYIAVGIENNPTSIIVNDSCTEIIIYAFYGCKSLTSVTIGNSVTTISISAFEYCSGLTSVTIGSSVTSIGEYAFNWCTGLTSVTIPDSVTSIDKYAFYNCTGLTSVTIPDSVTSIYGYAFSGCTGLTSVTIPNSVTSIVGYTFSNCYGLTSVTIGSSVTSIGNYAFSNCYKLLEVINKSSLTITAGSDRVSGSINYDYLGYYAKQIITDASQSKYQVIDNIKYYIDSSNNEYIAVGIENNPTNITINNSCTEINACAFYWCTGLTSVTIPNSVTSIGYAAFSGCTGLTSATIPNSVTSIGISAFRDCSGLTSVMIPNSVTSIGEYAFYCCTGLTSVYFLHDYTSGVQASSSSSPNYIGCYAFTDGNSNVTYYFINQASRDNAYNITYTSGSYYTYTRSSFFTGSNFEVMTPQFNVEVNNSNLGSVSGNTNLAIGESTTLTATPNTGCTFKYWLKDGYQFEGNTNNVLTTTFTEYLVTYTAVFGVYFTITTNVSNSEYGTVTSGGTYLNDTEITLTATPNTGYVFVKWLKDNEEFLGNATNPLTAQVTSNVTYTAVFEAGASIIVENITPLCGTVTGAGEYVLNTQLTLTATPNTGSKFFYWLKNGQTFGGSLSNPLTITVTEDATYTVVFAPADYNPQISSPNSVILETEYQGVETTNPEVCGIVKTYGYGNVDNMTTVRVEAIATTGYRFVGWKINGETTISSKYTTATADILLSDIPNSKIIIAVFDKAT